jgi:hypothetical protein
MGERLWQELPLPFLGAKNVLQSVGCCVIVWREAPNDHTTYPFLFFVHQFAQLAKYFKCGGFVGDALG